MREASNFAVTVDNTFIFIFGICFVLLIGLTATMILFIIKYNRKRHPNPVQIKEHLWLELTWTIVPLIIVLTMFIYGYKVYDPMLKPPANALKITVIGRQWEWKFVYANGKESKNLVVPYRKPVLLTLKSMDVIHSLSIPAFRIKEDIVPGKKDNFLWFIPTIKDSFEIFCSAYCGVSHSYMLSKVIILDTADYSKWYAQAEVKSETEKMPGFALINNNACFSCHSKDGSRIVGPSFKGLYGSTATVVLNGKDISLKVDDNYIKNKILGNEKSVVKTYPVGVMRQYKGVLTDENIKDIIDYFKTLK